MSTLQVENLIGPTSGSNANKVIIPSGQTLHAPGHVIQVVEGSSSTNTQINGATFADTSLSVSITPKSSSSKVLVLIQQTYAAANGGTTEMGVGLKLFRGSTEIAAINDSARAMAQLQTSDGSSQQMAGTAFLQKLDSPATTSAITYKTQGATYAASNTTNLTCQKNGTVSRITVMEIAQ